MEIEFYEKPGCVNNTKQKQLLESHGHTIKAYSLLTQNWTPDTLRVFFGDLPVWRWFNMSAPRIKSGEIDPNNFNEQTALAAMVSEPLLIRRPLIHIGENSFCGFDHESVNDLINNTDVTTLLSCPNLKNVCK